MIVGRTVSYGVMVCVMNSTGIVKFWKLIVKLSSVKAWSEEFI